MAAIHSPDDSQAVETALRTCQDAQLLIDINSEHLEDLRTKMATTSGKITSSFAVSFS